MSPPRLPDRLKAWDDILDSSGLVDHDYSEKDVAFRRYLENRTKHRRPPVWEGGEFDAVNCHLGLEGNKRARGPLHAFYLLVRDAARYRTLTWLDAMRALRVLQQVPGLETLRLPDEVNETIVEWRAQREVFPNHGDDDEKNL